MRIFISQPMYGKTEEEIMATRAKISKSLKRTFGDNVKIIDSYFGYIPRGGNIPLKYLGKSIENLAKADAAFFADGWSKARGCRIEHECCKQYNIRIIRD